MLAMLFRQEKIILILLCVVYTLIGYYAEQPFKSHLGLMGWLGTIQLVYCVMSWVKRGNQFISPYIIFLLSLYVFSFGQSFLWAFGLEAKRTLIGYYGITVSDIFYAQVLTLIMLAFFHIGASFWFTRNIGQVSEQIEIESDTNEETYVDDRTFRLRQIGWLIFVISVVPYTMETIQNLITSMSMGYGALYRGEEKIGMDNMAGFVSDFFIPSVICLFISYKNNKWIRRFFLGVLSLNIVAILLIGGRSNAVILLAILIILYNYLIKKIDKKWFFVGVFGIFLLLQILTFIANIRSEKGRTVNISNIKFESKAAADAVAEMGGTMFCLIKTMDIVPNKQSYRYGKSYLYSFTTLIPNLGFWKIHPAKKESNLGVWLTNYLHLGYGTGFSMCAEAYVNFGYFSFIVFFIWGWFLASIFGKIEMTARTQNYVLMAFLLILFWYFLKLPRNSFINLVRPIFFVAGPIYLYCTKIRFK